MHWRLGIYRPKSKLKSFTFIGLRIFSLFLCVRSHCNVLQAWQLISTFISWYLTFPTFTIDWPVSLPPFRRAKRSQIGYSLAWQATFTRVTLTWQNWSNEMNIYLLDCCVFNYYGFTFPPVRGKRLQLIRRSVLGQISMPQFANLSGRWQWSTTSQRGL